VRWMMRPTRMPVIAVVTATGRIRTPDVMGADERTAWKYLEEVS